MLPTTRTSPSRFPQLARKAAAEMTVPGAVPSLPCRGLDAVALPQQLPGRSVVDLILADPIIARFEDDGRQNQAGPALLD